MAQAADRTYSQVVPLLVAVLVCDVAVADPATGKKNLIGIFDVVHVRNFPTTRPMSLYFKVADAEGTYKIEVRYVQVSTGKVIGSAEGELSTTDRLTTSEMHLTFPPLPIPEMGAYEFQIWANSMFLGAASMRAVQRGG